MPVRIRLQRKGRKKAPFYHIVIANSESPRDGKFIERIGSYNPLTKPATIVLDKEKALTWLDKGAQPSDTVRAILRFQGVLYKKHLQRGVRKGVMSQEQADETFNAWMEKKEATVATRRAQTADEMEARRLKIFGEIPKKPAAPAQEEEATTEEEAAPAEENNDAEA